MSWKSRRANTISPMQSNDLLAYVSYLVIRKYKEKVGEPPTGLYFNKLMSPCNLNLVNKHVNINLPHYWYRYGDQVYMHSMPRNLVLNHETPTKTTVEWMDEEPAPVSDKSHNLIEKVVSKLTERYSNDIHQAVRDVYKYAPFDFQREYLDLREAFYGEKNAFNWDALAYKTISAHLLVNAFSKFPEKSFPKLNRQYAVVKTLIETTLREEWEFKLVEEVCTNFWFLFCYHLRLNKRCRENIPEESISCWEGRIEFEDIRYRRIIGDLLIEITENHQNILKDELLKEEYDWRMKDLKETEEIIDELGEDLKGLGYFGKKKNE